ncbi:hypothetical protein [Gilvimarinus polysaccharolyticus]|uniref:hypothetical protein n=1 Tax=Gilvimarinus polysaccharolyticus TaxID=863921 RepID=UPI0006731128|nr:hypothetical protein [Gilvimarinus polysaccharolyticus]
MNTPISQSVLVAVFSICCSAQAAPSDIGSDLYQKVAISGDKVPVQALEAVQKLQPGFVLQEAEQESKHGNQYLDLEGLTADGSEIEFDMLLNKQKIWEIVEIQRDLELADCPTPVRELYNKTFESQPAQRIIESKQMTGAVIYEFYFVSQDGETRKSEIKLEEDMAILLEKEWQH